MKSRTTRAFRDQLARLPAEVKRQARETYRQFQSDLRHPALRFKRVHLQEPVYSARININYRAVGVMEGDTIIWFWIGSHAEYDKLLDQL